MKRLGVLLLLALAATSRAGDDEEVAKAKAAFDAIVHEAETDVRTPPRDSLTKLVHDLLEHDGGVVRRVEASAWRDSRHGDATPDRHTLEVENVIHFLHGLPRRPDSGSLIEYGESTGFELVAGAVVLRRASGESHSGPAMKALDVSFDELVGKTVLRTLPLPKAADLLTVEVLDDESPRNPSWSISALIDFSTALGEACATDDAGFSKLLARATDHPRTRHLLLALGWTRRQDAVVHLSHTIAELSAAGWTRSVYPWWPSAIDCAIAGLRLADEDAWVRLAASLSDEQSCRVLGKPSASDVTRSRLAALAAATDPASRRAASLRLCGTCRSLPAIPGGADATRLFKALAACADSGDAELRATALAAAETLLVGPRRPAVSTYGGPDGTQESRGECIGAVSGAETALRLVAADIAAGRIEFRDAPVPEAECVARVGDARSTAVSDVARVSLSERPSIPVRVSGAWTKDGLHLRFVNEGRQRIDIDPVGLRYGFAAPVVVTTRRTGEAPTAEDRVEITLGYVAPNAAVPARFLVALAPRGVFEFDLPVREEVRGARAVDVRIWAYLPIVGKSPWQVLRFEFTGAL